MTRKRAQIWSPMTPRMSPRIVSNWSGSSNLFSNSKRFRSDNEENINPLMMFETPTMKKESKWAALEGLVIEVEGNIGSGKSTLTKAMKTVMNTASSSDNASEVFFETINNDFLAAFYTETKRYSFAFQMYMLTTRLYQMEEATRQAKQEGKMVMLDRGAVGDTVFAILNHTMGNMDDTEFGIYKSVCRDRLPRSISDKVDMVLYLDVDPDTCHRRVTGERKNDAEEGIPISYLRAVDECYFHLMMDWMGGVDAKQSEYIDHNCGTPPPLLVLSWDKYGTPSSVLAEVEKLVKKQRRVPTISFCDDSCANTPPVSHTVEINSNEEMDRTYASLQEHGAATLFLTTQKAVIDWNLAHSNAYRRVVFAILSQCINVHFHGRVFSSCEEETEEASVASTSEHSEASDDLMPSSPVCSSPVSELSN
jgi:deoxyadenosine/deoxycytidine kinase